MKAQNNSQLHPEYQYLNLLQDIMDNGVENIDDGTGARTLSVFGRQIRFDLSEGFPLLTTKKVYWKGVLHELYWFLSGDGNVANLAKNKVGIWNDYPLRYYNEAVKRGEEPELSKEDFVAKLVSDEDFANKYGELPNIYGTLWRHWPTCDGRKIDQVQWLIDELRQDPYARNTLVTSWNPRFLYSMALPEEANRYPICHAFYQVSIKGGKLHLQLYQRSADMFLGVPFNIASYALLTHIFAQVLGLEAGEFVHTFGDAHIYDTHFDQVQEQLTREPLPFPKLVIDSGVKEIDDFLPEHANLSDYESHDTIKAQMAVVGGVKKRDLEQ